MPADTDPAAIARRLSPAQKRALLAGKASNWGNRNSLITETLVIADRGGMSITLTPLGLAVRAVIAAEGGADG